jgi:hypothetical protein
VYNIYRYLTLTHALAFVSQVRRTWPDWSIDRPITLTHHHHHHPSPFHPSPSPFTLTLHLDPSPSPSPFNTLTIHHHPLLSPFTLQPHPSPTPSKHHHPLLSPVTLTFTLHPHVSFTPPQGNYPALELLHSNDWVTVGLATAGEAEVLASTPKEVRDTVTISWLARAVTQGQEKGLLSKLGASTVNAMVHELRMFCATTPSISAMKQPNLWSSLMNVVVNLLLLLYLVGLPFTCFSYDSGAVQYFTISTSAILTFPWICMGALIEWSQTMWIERTSICMPRACSSCMCNSMAHECATAWLMDVHDQCIWYRLVAPFHSKRDSLNVDGLICWSERIIFTNMRTCFSAAVGGSGPAKFAGHWSNLRLSDSSIC